MTSWTTWLGSMACTAGLRLLFVNVVSSSFWPGQQMSKSGNAIAKPKRRFGNGYNHTRRQRNDSLEKTAHRNALLDAHCRL